MSDSAQTHNWLSRHGLKRMGVAALDVLLPPRCLKCGIVMAQTGNLCPSCWKGIHFIAPPLCAKCGIPFDFEIEPGALCGGCAREAPTYDHARAVFRYDDFSRDLILAFKYGDRTDAAPAFGGWLARAGAELLAGAEVLVPVPLHWTRMFTRRYNQAVLLAFALSRQAGIPVVPDLLLRHRRTLPQGRMKAKERRRNLRGAIALHPAKAGLAEGRHIVLIDDVVTSGATACECARVLYKAGARSVDVLALARVDHPSLDRR